MSTTRYEETEKLLLIVYTPNDAAGELNYRNKHYTMLEKRPSPNIFSMMQDVPAVQSMSIEYQDTPIHIPPMT